MKNIYIHMINLNILIKKYSYKIKKNQYDDI